MSNLKERVAAINKQSYPTSEIERTLEITPSSWSKLSKEIGLALYKKRVPLKKLWLNILDEVNDDSAKNKEHAAANRLIVTNLALLVTGLWNLKATHPLRPENLDNLKNIPS